MQQNINMSTTSEIHQSSIEEFVLYEPFPEPYSLPENFVGKVQKYLYKIKSSGRKIFFTKLEQDSAIQKTRSKKSAPIFEEKSLIEMNAHNDKKNEYLWKCFNQPKKRNLHDHMEIIVTSCINPDLCLQLSNRKFFCHKIVFQGYSNAYLNIDHSHVYLDENVVSLKSFKTTYKWMLGKVPALKRANILDIFNTAKYLRAQELVDLCYLYFADDRRFNEDTAMMLYLEAKRFKMKKLPKLLMTRMNNCFLALVASKEFLYLDPADVYFLFKKNGIAVNSEVEVFMAFVRWLSHNWKDRLHKLPRIIAQIRFGLIPAHLLVRFLTTVDCFYIKKICSLFMVKKYIDKAIVYSSNSALYGDRMHSLRKTQGRQKEDEPVDRNWIIDSACPYHHSVRCQYVEQVSYENFNQYLDVVCRAGPRHWKTLRKPLLLKQVDQPCENPKCTELFEKMRAPDIVDPFHAGPIEENGIVHYQRSDTLEVIKEKLLTDGNKEHPFERPPKVYCEHRLWIQGNYQSKQDEYEHMANSFNQQESSPSIVDPSCITIRPTPEQLREIEAFLAEPSLPGFAETEIKYSSSDIAEDADSVPIATQTISLSASSFESDKRLYNETRYDERFEIVEPYSTRTSRKGLPKYSIVAGIKNSSNQFSTKTLILIGGVNPLCCHCMKSSNSDMEELLYNENLGKEVLYYDEYLRLWRKLCYIPFALRHHHAAVQCNGFIYVIGGTSCVSDCIHDGELDGSIWRLELRNCEWRRDSVLPEPRKDFAAISIEKSRKRCKRSNGDGKLGVGFFVIGGEGCNGEPLDSVLFYDVMKKKWTEKASLNTARYGLTAALINDEIWVAGGTTTIVNRSSDLATGGYKKTSKTAMTSSIEIFSLKCTKAVKCPDCDRFGMGKWTMSEIQLRSANTFGKFCKYSDKDVFFVGGATVDPNNERLRSMPCIDYLNLRNRKWERHGALCYARQGHDAIIMNNRLIVVGGVSSEFKRGLTEVEVFDIQKYLLTNEICNIPLPKSGLTLIAATEV